MTNSTKNFILVLVTLVFIGIALLNGIISYWNAFFGSFMACALLHNLFYSDDVDFELDNATVGKEFPEDPFDGEVFFLEQESDVLVFVWDDAIEVWNQIGRINRSTSLTV
jgi:hypothetical protein